MAVSEDMIVIPSTQQARRRVDSRSGMSVCDELLDQEIRIGVANGRSSLCSGASSRRMHHRSISPVGHALDGVSSRR